jgi:hypothetical protein
MVTLFKNTIETFDILQPQLDALKIFCSNNIDVLTAIDQIEMNKEIVYRHFVSEVRIINESASENTQVIICDINDTKKAIDYEILNENLDAAEKSLQIQLNRLKDDMCASCRYKLVPKLEDIQAQLDQLANKFSHTSDGRVSFDDSEIVDDDDEVNLSTNSNEKEIIRKQDDNLIVRILVADYKPNVVDTHDTIGRFMLGKVGEKINDFFIKTMLYNFFVLILDLLGTFLPLLSLNGVIDENYLYCSLLMGPLAIHMLLLLNRQIVLKLLRTFETMYCALNGIGFCVFIMLMIKNNSVLNIGGLSCFSFSCLFCIMIILLSDAFPAAGRKMFAYIGVTYTIIFCLLLLCSIFFHLATVLQDHTYQIQYMTIAASGQCISCLNNILIFSVRNLHNAIHKSDAMVSCKHYYCINIIMILSYIHIFL